MNFSTGNVIRLSYKWPHQSRRQDGHKDRAAVVFQTDGDRQFVSPLSTVPPDEESRPYAVPVPANLQRQLGLSTDKPSWIYANHANLVETPNPAIQPARRDGVGTTKWLHGNLPPGILAAMRSNRESAIADRNMQIQHIKKDEGMENFRSANKVARLSPTDPAKAGTRAENVRQKALERAAREERPTLSLKFKRTADQAR